MASPYTDAVQRLDGNGYPIHAELPFLSTKTVTFAGATTNAWGDDGGTLDGGVLFTVTGLVQVRLVARCTTDCTGAGSTDEVGITGATAIFMPTTTMTNLDVGEIWLNNATPASYFIIGEEEAAADNYPIYLLNGNDIIMTTATANTEAGVVEFYCYWKPISVDGQVIDAGN
jgi:hypothetical protein